MRALTEPVTIVQFGQYGDDIKYGDGTLVEFVDFLVPGEEQNRRIKVDRAIEQRPNVGAQVVLQLAMTRRMDAAIGQSGKPYIRTSDKFAVTAFLRPDSIAPKAKG